MNLHSLIPDALKGPVLGDLNASFREDMKSPFVRSFIVSWLICNYDFLLFVIEYDGVYLLDRIAIANSVFGGYSNLLWLPLGFALVGTLFYILLGSVWFWLWGVFKSFKRRLQALHENKRPTLNVDYRKAIEALREKVREYSELENELQISKGSLEQQISELKIEKSELLDKITEANDLHIKEQNKNIELQNEMSIRANRIKELTRQLEEEKKEKLSFQKSLNNKEMELKQIKIDFEELITSKTNELEKLKKDAKQYGLTISNDSTYTFKNRTKM